MINELIKILIISLFLSSVSFTIATSVVFEKFRNWVKSKNESWGKMINCPHCLSHWILFGTLSITYFSFTPVEIFSNFFIANLIVTYFAIICLSSIFHFILLRAYLVKADSAFLSSKEALKNKLQSLKQN